MIKYLITFLLAGSTAWAGIGIGVAPYPGPGVIGGETPGGFATDDFSGTGALSGDWSQAYDWPIPARVSDQIKGNSAGNQLARYTGTLFSSNQFASLRVTSTSDSLAPCVRVQSTSNSGYCAKLINHPSYFAIIKIESGVESSIKLVWDTVSVGDVIGISISGTTITAYKNGNPYSSETIEDSTYSTGGPGVWTWGTTTTADDFSAYDL